MSRRGMLKFRPSAKLISGKPAWSDLDLPELYSALPPIEKSLSEFQSLSGLASISED